MPDLSSHDGAGLLKPEAPWVFYESQAEIDKLVRRIRSFLLPELRRLQARRVLEVGCGSGRGTVFLREQGLDAWGIDPYFREGISEAYPYLLAGSGQSLPFDDRSFDVAFALEVIEHVGTIDGSVTVTSDHAIQRQRFISESGRVAARSVIIATPNKRFPVDEHAADSGGAPSFRFHSPLERFTLSVGELEAMFRRAGFVLGEFLDPSGYYALERVERRFGRIGRTGASILLATATNPWLARSVFNPHLFLRFDRID